MSLPWEASLAGEKLTYSNVQEIEQEEEMQRDNLKYFNDFMGLKLVSTAMCLLY